MHINNSTVQLHIFDISINELKTSACGHLDHPVAQEKKTRDKNLFKYVWLKFSLGKPVSHQILTTNYLYPYQTGKLN